MSAMGYYICAIDMTQRGFCQGGNVWGELGFAGVDLDAGMYFTCAIGNDGFTYCWGNNSSGEMGDGTMLRKSTPQRVVAPLP